MGCQNVQPVNELRAHPDVGGGQEIDGGTQILTVDKKITKSTFGKNKIF